MAKRTPKIPMAPIGDAPRVRCEAFSGLSQQRCALWAVPGGTKCHSHGGVADKQKRPPALTEQCRATSRQGRCGNRSIPGGAVCRFHGGRTPQVIEAAKKRVALTEARNQMVTLGIPVEGLDPYDALMEEIARTAGHVRWLQGIVLGINPDDLIWGKTEEEHSTGFDDKNNYDITKHGAVPNIWMQLYQKEREHLVNVSKIAIGAGIAERQVKIAERQGDMIVKIMKAVLGDPKLGLTAEQQEEAKHVVGHHLRLIAGGVKDPKPVAVDA